MLKNEKKKMRMSLLWRVIASVLLILVFLACGLVSVYVVSMNRTAEKEYQNLIQTTISNIDKVFSETIDITRKCCSSLYDSLEGERLRIEEEYAINHVVSFCSDLTMCFQVCPYVQSVYVISMDNEVELYSTNPYCSVYTEPLNDLLVEKLNGIDGKWKPFLWTVKNRYRNQDDVDLFSIYYRDTLPSNAAYRGTVVINIDTRLLSSYLFSASNDNEIVFYILNQDGCVVAHSNPNLCGQDWSGNEHVQKILQSNAFVSSINSNGEAYELYSNKSMTEGYYVVAEAQKHGLFVGTDGTYTKSLVIMAAIILFAAAVLLSVCQYIFFPFNRIIQEMKKSNLSQIGEDRDDIAVLSQYHNDVSQYVKQLQQKEARNKIVKAILAGQNVERAIRSQTGQFFDSGYRIIIVHLGNVNNASLQLADYDNYRAIAEKEFEHVFGDGNSCVCLEMGFRRIMVIIRSEIDNQTLELKITSIADKIKSEHDLKTVWFYSEPIFGDNPERNCTSVYEYGENRLQGRSFVEEDIDQVIINEQQPKADWRKYRIQALRYAEKNLRNEFNDVISLLLDAMKDQGRNQILSAFSSLAVDLYKISNNGIAPKDYEENARKEIDKMQSRDELIRWIDELAVQFTTGSQREEGRGNISTMENMVAYIQNHYQENDLCLNSIANHLYISAAYLGKQFRSFAGMSFNDYLTRIRMERAADLLLLKREESISAIAQEVGYSNGSYFASSFKNFYGVNPTTYRTTRKQEAAESNDVEDDGLDSEQ